MRRFRLFELEDQGWFPRPIRDAGTDFLRLMSEIGNVFKPIVPRLEEVLTRTGIRGIVT